MLTVVQDADEANGNEAGQRSLLDAIDRDGARQMLAAAWQAEVAVYVEPFADQRDDTALAWCYATDITSPARC
jgi:hypothetical protein